jgi:hypothetical protein
VASEPEALLQVLTNTIYGPKCPSSNNQVRSLAAYIGS